MLTILLAVAFGCGGSPMDRELAPILGRRWASSPIDTLGVPSIVKAGRQEAWQAVHTALGELGLEINFRDPAEGRVGTCYQLVRGRLGKVLLSSYLDCGETRSVPNADQYDVVVTVLVSVRLNPDHTTTVSTFVIGVGRDGRGSSSDRVWCRSTGQLEEEIHRRVEQG